MIVRMLVVAIVRRVVSKVVGIHAAVPAEHAAPDASRAALLRPADHQMWQVYLG